MWTNSKVALLACFLLLLLAAVPVQTADEGDRLFALADSNNDGSINKEEYEIMIKKLNQVLVEESSTRSLNLDSVQQWWSSFVSQYVGSNNKGFVSAFTSSLAMIIATEIGDKTFFIAAVLSMKNDRLAVFGGAILALIIMTVLSTVMGMVLPSILPRKYTHIIGGLLFLYFGFKLIYDSHSMESNKVSDELEEVEEELGSNKKQESDIEGNTDSINIDTKKKSKPTSSQSSYWSRIFMQSLGLTFVAEWGDRSQIATIALAAAKDPSGVTVGAIVGHSLCTGMAVIGGRMLASRISEKTVSLWGGIIFLLFGVHGLFFET